MSYRYLADHNKKFMAGLVRSTGSCAIQPGQGDHNWGRNAPVRPVLQRQIDLTDRQIDALVYELYGLTEEEIRLVEGR